MAAPAPIFNIDLCHGPETDPRGTFNLERPRRASPPRRRDANLPWYPHPLPPPAPPRSTPRALFFTSQRARGQHGAENASPAPPR